jgi:hypothetical protein
MPQIIELPKDVEQFHHWMQLIDAVRGFHYLMDEHRCPYCLEKTATYEWCGSVLVLHCPCKGEKPTD